MFKLAIISLIIISAVFASGIPNEDVLFKKYQEFTIKYNKVYSSDLEFKLRFENFKNNFIENAFSGKGITQFFDLSKEEAQKQNLTERLRCNPSNKVRSPLYPTSLLKDIPESLDWRTNGKVSVIKNQSQLDTSFAFSSVAYLESQSLIKYNKMNLYSERQILECDTDTSHLMESALLYVEKYGIESEIDYGKGQEGACKYDPSKVISRVKSVRCYEDPSELEIKTYLNQVGPLSIALSSTDLSNYYGGVLNCKVNDKLDLGVLLIGYGSDSNNSPFWIIKNSWGTSWGERGFARISSVEGQNCGIGQYVVDADME